MTITNPIIDLNDLHNLVGNAEDEYDMDNCKVLAFIDRATMTPSKRLKVRASRTARSTRRCLAKARMRLTKGVTMKQYMRDAGKFRKSSDMPTLLFVAHLRYLRGQEIAQRKALTGHNTPIDLIRLGAVSMVMLFMVGCTSPSPGGTACPSNDFIGPPYSWSEQLASDVNTPSSPTARRRSP